MVLKKTSTITNRGTPPPIPPNKPLIIKKDLHSTKKSDQGDNEKKNVQLVTCKRSKDEAKKDTNVAETIIMARESVGQNLADFQNIGVSMSTTKDFATTSILDS